jgi:hypothetical protein
MNRLPKLKGGLFFMLLGNDILSEAVEEFISLRISQYGSDEPTVLQEMAQCYKKSVDRLLPTLSHVYQE